MTALERLAALQRIREERVQELLRVVGDEERSDAWPALLSAAAAVRSAGYEVELLARAIQPIDRAASDDDAVLSVALVAAMLNLVSAAETVIVEGKLPAILHQLLKTHARQVRDLIESRRRRLLVAAAERTRAGAGVPS